MKLIYTAIIAVLSTSCMTTSFYQVYTAVPSDKSISKDRNLVYEDDNCSVSYNFWEQGGNIGFTFYNKTDKNIYLNLEESFFILNGMAHNYFRDRVFTNSTSSGVKTSQTATISKTVSGINVLNLLQSNGLQATSSAGRMTSFEQSVSYNEEKVICIPSKTSKIVVEYSINKLLYRDCDLLRYPKKDQLRRSENSQPKHPNSQVVRTKAFSKEESPIVFSNRIAYTVEQSDNLIKFENEFYVAEISNYPEKELLVSKQEEFCGQKSSVGKVEYFKDVSPEKFYIKYKKEGIWKH